MKLQISFFLPAYNESGNIEEAVRKAKEVLVLVASEYEIIIVNDGSKDDTGKIIDQIASKDSKVKVIHHEVNKGYGDALWTGIQTAKYEWFFFTDSDLQFDIKEISKLIKFIPEYKIVIGYRSPRKDPFMRLVNAKGWNILVRLLFGLKVKDIDCAFKMINTKMVASLPLITRGATMSAEILIRLQKNGVSWKEVPVTHLPRKKGSATGAKPKVIIKAFKELFKLYRKGI